MVFGLSKKIAGLRLFDRLATAGIVFQLGLALSGRPGITSPPPAMTLAGNGLILILAAISLWRRGQLSRLSLYGLLLGGWSWAASSQSLCPFLSQVNLCSLAGFIGMICLLNGKTPERGLWTTVAHAMVGWAGVSSVVALYQWNLQGNQGPLQGNFTNQDCYSVIPMVGSLLALGLGLESNRFKIGYFLMGAMLTTTMVLTASRAALLGFSFGMVGILFTLTSSRSPRYQSQAVKLLAATAALALVGILSGMNSQLWIRLSQLARGEDPITIKSRLDVLKTAPKTLARSPWLGWGPGCFHLAYEQDRPNLIPGEEYMNVAHNDYAQWFIETGLVGGILWLCLFLEALGSAWRSYRSPSPWVASQVSVIVAISIYCLLNFASPVPADLLWIGACLGLSNTLMKFKKSDSQEVVAWRPKWFPLSLLLMAWGFWSVIFAYRCACDNAIIEGCSALENSLDWEAAIATVRPAADSEPDDFRLQIKEAELARRLFVFSGNSDWLQLQMTAIERARQASPRDPSILVAQIRLLLEQRRLVEASGRLDEAEIYLAYSPELKRMRALSQIYQGQFDKAAATLLALGQVSQAKDNEALADLVYLLEAKKSSVGVDLLGKLAAKDDERACAVGAAAARRATELLDYSAAMKFLRRVRSIAPTRQDILYQIAETRGLAGDPKQELSFLASLRNKPDLENDPEVSERVWRRWTELSLAQGDPKYVQAQLDDYLINHPRKNWARLVISDILLKLGQGSEARAALRDGIPYDQDGSLRIRLGELCAQQGLLDLARSYYSEARPLTADKASLEKRIRELRSSESFDPEEL